jgi:hypothetical protein
LSENAENQGIFTAYLRLAAGMITMAASKLQEERWHWSYPTKTLKRIDHARRYRRAGTALYGLGKRQRR